jgi:hypothetical protein
MNILNRHSRVAINNPSLPSSALFDHDFGLGTHNPRVQTHTRKCTQEIDNGLLVVCEEVDGKCTQECKVIPAGINSV